MRSGLVTTPAFADGKRSVKGGLLTAPHNYQLKPRIIWGVTGPAGRSWQKYLSHLGAIEVPAVGTEVRGLSVVSLSASAHQARRQWSFGLAIPWRILPIWRTRVLFRMPTRYRSPYSADMPSC